MINILKHAVGIVAIAALSGCVSLPRGAAVESEILKSADDVDADFAIYPVTRSFLPSVAQWPRTGEPHRQWIAGSRGSDEQVIRAGDTIDLQIWDSGENSLLTSTEQRVANMQAIRVSTSGTIFVPYVGKVNIAGRTPDSARQAIQRSLEAIVPSAQVQLSLIEGRRNSVDLVGGVSQPGSYPMPDQNYTVLSLIADAGGVRDALNNPQVTLLRGGSIYGTSVETLFENPALDTRLRGGDKVIIEKDDRYFLSLGATGKEALHLFTRDKVTALDALSIIGGVNDARADPKGILILREYPADAVRPGVRGPRQTRVVFTLDLTTSDGLFSARKFDIYSGDLVLATESPITNARTILGLVGSVFGVANTLNNSTN
ncbi:polysaccharide biosynthesis/export family protein [Sulfitobacter sabulilitoris]|uniref:Polysaccharide export protein n=1 Tax=Sulfitobacter sabulilitoris TaxID=2562655 RepID=A0A5S3PF80_9RHOB|nr:polysaccharide biosynthesis/export family protein [Sulfitobacter sabulilitoris]TMM52705.1 polysaccharide export protein [Sulfitobacter sabulilitoris]